jgi:hypothetical protein
MVRSGERITRRKNSALGDRIIQTILAEQDAP